MVAVARPRQIHTKQEDQRSSKGMKYPSTSQTLTIQRQATRFLLLVVEKHHHRLIQVKENCLG